MSKSTHTSPIIAVIRVIQLLLNIVVIAIIAADFKEWHNLGCRMPVKEIANLALACVSFPVVLWLFFSAGCFHRCLVLPWSRYIQLFLDFFLLLLWIVAGALSLLKCGDICRACTNRGRSYYNSGYGHNYFVSRLGKYCSCVFSPPSRKLKRGDDIFGASMSFEKRRGGSRGGGSRSGSGSSSGSRSGVIGLLLTAIFIYIDYSTRRHERRNTALNAAAVRTHGEKSGLANGNGAAAAPAAGPPPVHQNTNAVPPQTHSTHPPPQPGTSYTPHAQPEPFPAPRTSNAPPHAESPQPSYYGNSTPPTVQQSPQLGLAHQYQQANAPAPMQPHGSNPSFQPPSGPPPGHYAAPVPGVEGSRPPQTYTS